MWTTVPIYIHRTFSILPFLVEELIPTSHSWMNFIYVIFIIGRNRNDYVQKIFVVIYLFSSSTFIPYITQPIFKVCLCTNILS